MARFQYKEKALALRKQEWSYSQIKNALGISKSTLSCWLRDYPLSKKRIRELRDCNEQRIERYRETMRKKREQRLNNFYLEQKNKIFPLKNKELFIAGLFLYWGEGTKTFQSAFSVSNTDPSVIKFFIYWLIKCLKVPREKLRIGLQLYNDMNIEKEKNFWSETLNISLTQFFKPYIKKTSSKNISHKGGFGHGTCNVTVCNARLLEKNLMALKAISNKYLNMRV